MRPLLWKEMRDLLPWVAGGAILLGGLELLLQSQAIRDTWGGAFYPFFLPLLLTVAAVGLGAGQIARERHTRTLDYLLVRPVSPALVLWAKFIAGTAALALLLAGVVALGFVQPDLWRDATARAIQQQAGYRALALVLFPRYWCIYGLTLFLSVLLDRTAKVAVLMTVAAIALPAWAVFLETAAPFSRFLYWLPFLDGEMGLLLAAKSAALTAWTGAVFSLAALLLAFAGAALLRRSPERYLGNPGFAVVTLGIVGAAILSAQAAAHRLPPAPPAAAFALDEAGGDLPASGALVAVPQEHAARFVDFSTPSHPREAALVQLPLSYQRITMTGDTAVLVGEKKALPVDQAEVVLVQPSGSMQEIPLGPVRVGQHFSAAVMDGRFLYIWVAGETESSVRVYHLASREQVASLPLDGASLVTLGLRAPYLYAASPGALTTIDLQVPAHPRIVARTPVPPRFLLGVPYRMALQDDRLFLLQLYPSSLESFSLRDPAHPVRQASLEYHSATELVASSRALYRPWQHGLLEFQPEGGALRARRYLASGQEIVAVAASGDRVFTLTVSDDRYRRRLEMYR